MTVGLITIRELLRDPQFKKYFTTVPKLPDHYTPDALPWRLLIQKHGETNWRAKRFGTYKEAFDAFKLILPKAQDAAINCPGLNFMPPIRTVRLKGKFEKVNGQMVPIMRTIVWKAPIEADMLPHHWCGYCRRPTVFGDKAIGVRVLNGYRLPTTQIHYRCLLCGAPAHLMDIRHPELNQQWDPNRPTIYR